MIVLIIIDFLKVALINVNNGRPFKITMIWNKSYDVEVKAYGAIKKLSCFLNYIVTLTMWTKFDNSRVLLKKITITLNLEGFDQRNWFF